MKRSRYPADPRRGALDLVAAVLGERVPLTDLVATPPSSIMQLDGPGRARAQRLALTTLRNVERADTVLEQFLRKPPPLPIMNILRLATTEILQEGEAAHGVVHSAVNFARSDSRTAGLSGLVNAVLRKVAVVPLTSWNELPPQRLPHWLREPLVNAYGRAAVSAIEAAHLAGAPLDLTAREDAPAWAERLGGHLLPTGSIRLPGGHVQEMEGYREGAWWVQDAAAALPAKLLAVRPGEEVLDLCAAPGGKTLQLAAAGARVTALDISGPRIRRLRDNLERTRLNAEIVVADALHWTPAQSFDAILLDAPCSATGTIRRHPDLPFVRKPEDVAALVALQAALLDRAVDYLRPGGRLVFCTCSLLPEEGEAQLSAALDRHPELSLRIPDLPDLPQEWHTPQGGLRLRPDHFAETGGLDGFFIALLTRTEALQ